MRQNKILSQGNIILILLVILQGHNIYLQLQIEKASNAAEDSEYQAKQAVNYASEAENAASYASEAANNAFGTQCWNCP
jgi:hypothetical protein